MLNQLNTNEEAIRLFIKYYLGASGVLFPTTVNQVRAFKLHKLPKLKRESHYPDSEAILDGDYKHFSINPEPKIKAMPEMEAGFRQAAARNGKAIPEEILRKMRKDRGE
jgi:hypothetical protein